MPFTANELTNYLKELKKTQDSLDQLLDFSDLAIRNDEKFEANLKLPAERIKNASEPIMESIKEFNDIFNEELDKLPLDIDEVNKAAEKLILYHGEKMQVLIWAEQQKVNFKEGSYWWNYWTGIVEYVKENKK